MNCRAARVLVRRTELAPREIDYSFCVTPLESYDQKFQLVDTMRRLQAQIGGDLPLLTLRALNSFGPVRYVSELWLGSDTQLRLSFRFNALLRTERQIARQEVVCRTIVDEQSLPVNSTSPVELRGRTPVLHVDSSGRWKDSTRQDVRCQPEKPPSCDWPVERGTARVVRCARRRLVGVILMFAGFSAFVWQKSSHSE